jgi:hypothetical protein
MAVSLPASTDRARSMPAWMALACRAGFEGFMGSCGEPAQSLTLPPRPSVPPDPGRMTAIAAEYGLDILGPPGIPS